MRAFLASSLVILGHLGVAATAHATDVSQPQPGLTLAQTPGDALVVADLCADGVSVRATRYDERQATPAEWAGAVGAEAAVNADFFDFPGWTLVNGRARGAGEDWPGDKMFFESRWYWQFGPSAAALVQADIVPIAAPAITEIVGGHNLIISGGVSQGPDFDGDAVILGAYRRTAVGLSADRRFLYLFVSTTPRNGTDLAAAMLERAAEAGFPQLDAATNMDGGGSSQMFVAGVGALFATGRQVNNHLGVLAKGAGPAPMCPFTPPIGWIDGAGCEFVTGWAQAPKEPSAVVSGVLAYDGQVFEPTTKYQDYVAGEYRDDLCQAIGSCEHGFRAPTAYGAMDGQPHAIRAYAGNPNPAGKASELSGSPITLAPCAAPTPTGLRRHIVDEASLAAWKFSTWVDVLHVSDDVFAALPEGDALEATPTLAISDDGAPEVWLIDGPVKRHVPSPAAFAAWHFDPAAITTRAASELAALPTATPLRERPMVLQASGPALMLVDDPRTPIDPGAGGGGGSTSAGATTTSGVGGGTGGDDAGATDDGCACRGARGAAWGASARLALAGLALAALARRRRRRAS